MNLSTQELKEIIKRRDNTISKKSKEIQALKDKFANEGVNSEYIQEINTLKVSEKELLSKERVYLAEIEELKDEISELLELIS